MPAVQTLEIVLYPDPRLTKRAREITADEIKSGAADGWNLAELSERMRATMYESDGVGLAGPQVGIGLRIFVYDTSENKTDAHTLINPVLVDMRGTLQEEEGCLSIPGVRAKVKRYKYLTVRGVNEKGEPVSFEATDLLARVCQHENDHLDGKLFIDKLGITGRMAVRRGLADLEYDYQQLKNKKQA